MGKLEKFLNRTVFPLVLFSFLWPFAVCGAASAGASSLKVRQAYLDFPSLTVYADLLDSSGKALTPAEGDKLTATVGDRALKIREWKRFSAKEQGMTIVFLVDVSGSIRPKRFEELRQTLSSWIRRMGPKDRAALVSFGENVTVVQDFTSEKKALLYSLQTLKPKAPHTQLNLGLIRALELARMKGADLPHRKMILLCSDGIDDMPGGATVEEVREAIAIDPVPVYSIFFDAEKMNRETRDAALKTIGEFSRRSGGQLHDAKAAPFPALFEKIEKSLDDSLILKVELEGLTPEGTAKRLEVAFTDGSITLSDGIAIRLVGKVAAEEASTDVVSNDPSVAVSADVPAEEKKLPKWAYPAAGGVALLLILGIFFAIRKRGQPPVVPTPGGGSTTVAIPSQGGTILVSKTPAEPQTKGPAIDLELVVTGTSGPGASYKVSFADRLVLGRNSGDSALAIPGDGTISGKHCELVFSAGKLFVRDLQSTNGTMVNGVPIQGNFPLKDGDRLTLGKTELRLRILNVR